MQTCNIMGVNIAVTDMDKTLRLVCLLYTSDAADD